MSKATVLPLAGVLLLMDIWPLGRWRLGIEPGRASHESSSGEESPLPPKTVWQLLLEKIPFIALSSLLLVFLLWARWDTFADMAELPLYARLVNAIPSYALYLKKVFWPRDLAPFYTHPYLGGGPWDTWEIVASAALLLAITVAAIIAAKKYRYRYALVGWLWFLGTMFPMIGIVQTHRESMADRYAYGPFIGLYLVLAWGLYDIFRAGRTARFVVVGGGMLGTATHITLSVVQVAYWHDDVVILRRGVEIQDRNVEAHLQLAELLARRNQHRRARYHCRCAVRIRPDDAAAHYMLGWVSIELGELAEAREHLKRALEIRPNYADAHVDLGVVAGWKHPAEAKAHFKRALRFDHNHELAHYNLGLALAREGKPEQARMHYELALRANPKNAHAHTDLGDLYLRQGNLDRAQAHYEEALRLRPGFPAARAGLARVQKLRSRKRVLKRAE